MRLIRQFCDNRYIQYAGEFYIKTLIMDYLKYPELRNKTTYISPREEYEFLDEYEQLVDFLVEHLKEVISYSCMCEFRHFGSELTTKSWSDDMEKYKFKSCKKFIKNCPFKVFSVNEAKGKFHLVNNMSRETSADSLKEVFKGDIYNIMESILPAFRNYTWSAYFGGAKWANGTEGWFRLHNAKTLNERVLAIDHAYDLQHHNGLLFDKDLRYEKISDKLNSLLTVKRNAKKLSEIMYIKRPGTNQYMKKEDIVCFPRSLRKILKFKHKLGLT